MDAAPSTRPVEPVALREALGRLRHHQNTVFLLVLASYLILNYSFMLLRVPVPGLGTTGVPIGEGVLLLSLFALPVLPIVRRLRETVGLAPLTVWWGIGGCYLVAAAWQAGGFGLRNGSHMIDSLFLLLGVQFMLVQNAGQRLARWLAWVLAIGAVYGLTYSFRDQLQPLVPSVVNTHGVESPLLFTYMTAPVLMLLSAAALLLLQRNLTSRTLRGVMTLGSVCAIAGALIPFQSRAVMLQAVLLWVVFLVMRRDLVWRYTFVLIAAVAVIPLVDALDVPMRPRITTAVTSDFYVGQALSAVGVDASPLLSLDDEGNTHRGLQASHGGWNWRLRLWEKTYAVWSQSWTTRLFGIGYAEPLIREPTKGFELRQPHNSYLSTLGKLGLLGLGAWLWLHAMLIWVWWRAWRACERSGRRTEASWLLLAGAFAAMVLLHGAAEDTFSKPYYMIPYYFLLGAALGWIADRRLLDEADGPSPGRGQEAPA